MCTTGKKAIVDGVYVCVVQIDYTEEEMKRAVKLASMSQLSLTAPSDKSAQSQPAVTGTVYSIIIYTIYIHTYIHVHMYIYYMVHT